MLALFLTLIRGITMVLELFLTLIRGIIIVLELFLTLITLLEINGITLIKKWYNPVAPLYTIYGITN